MTGDILAIALLAALVVTEAMRARREREYRESVEVMLGHILNLCETLEQTNDKLSERADAVEARLAQLEGR